MLDKGYSQSKVMAASSLGEGREPPYTLPEEIKAQEGPASPCMPSPQACASCPQNNSNPWVWRQRGRHFPAAPLLILNGGGSSSTFPQDLQLQPCSLVLAGRGLTMPRELQAASSLPSEEQWGHCGRPGKCGQIPRPGSYPLGGSLMPLR